MPMHRKNKAPRNGDGAQPWFTANVERQRRRKEMAKASRRKNRGK